MDPTRKLSYYVGSNEKTKVVVILQEQGDPRPMRERVSGKIPTITLKFMSVIEESLKAPQMESYLAKSQNVNASFVGEEDNEYVQAIDETEMFAWQFKKQQEQLALKADYEECTASAWADPHLLKHQMNGLGAIRWK